MNDEQLKTIRKGDILRRGNSLRVVRAAHHSVVNSGGVVNGHRVNVIFTIKRCSWTTRCYTVYTGSDLKTLGYQATGKRLALRGEKDFEIEQNFELSITDTTLHCCDVEGIG